MGRRRRDTPGQKEPRRDEIASAVCAKFCKGVNVSQIKTEVEHELKIKMTREKPYELLREEALAGRFLYEARTDSDLAARIREEYPWLYEVRVVRTRDRSAVAFHAAKVLQSIMMRWSAKELRIGFGGGGLLNETVRQLAALLRNGTVAPRFERLVLHALMAGSHDPSLSPNSFLHWFFDRPRPVERTEFVGVPMPSLVTGRTMETLRKLEGIKETFEQAEKIDVVVSSAGAHWNKGCSALHKLLEAKSPASTKSMEAAGCVGDVLWQPFGPQGPLDLASGYRAVTTIDLTRLSEMIGKGKLVVLALAPCLHCGDSKTDILKAVLQYKRGMITHLVADISTAAGLFA